MKWAEKCFSSLRRSFMQVQTIVVDNGSNDGTQDFIKTNFPEVEFIQSDKNLGFGKANNLGIEKAYKQGADFFYLMNQDAWIFEDSIQNLVDAYENHPKKEEIGILSPMHLDGSEEKLDLHFENYIGKEARENRLISDMYFQKLDNAYEISFVNAAHWFLPKAVIEKVGGFNPYFFHGAEDYDYTNRIKYFGLKIFVCPKSKVVHDTVQSFYKEEPKTKEETLKLNQLSLQMQKETKYMNPNYDFKPEREKKEFLSNIVKLRLKGNKELSDFHRNQYKFLKSRFKIIEEHRKISISAKNPFLNL